MKFTQCFILLACMALPVFAQPAATLYDPAKTYTIPELQEDMDALHQTMREINPSLYHYRSRKQVDSLFRIMANTISKPMTAIEARKALIVPAVVYLQDLHYVVYPSPGEEGYLRKNGMYFPFDIKLSGNKMYVWHNLSANADIKDKCRTEILEINGEKAADVINRLEQYIVTDGNSVAAKRKADMEESFRTYYALAYGRDEQYTLAIKTADEAQPRSVKIAAAGWDAISTMKETRYPEKQELPGLDIHADMNMAVLSIKTFSPEQAGVTDRQLENFIDSAFTIIKQKGIQKLILDLRGNIGGRVNYGGKLYSYLTNKPFKYLDRVELAFPHAFKYINSTSLGRTYLTNTYGMHAGKDSLYTLDNFQWATEQKPAANAYLGDLYILTDGYTLSTTGLFCSMARAYRSHTIFLGEETGGAYGSCSGMLTLLNLPNTGIRVYFPIRRYVSAAINEPGKNKGHTDRGVLPDVEVSNTIADYMNDKDAVLIKAMGPDR